jgi:drug/metabolite transporter (DMT)-like permease
MNKKGSLALFTAAGIYATFGILIREMTKMFSDNGQVAFRFGVAFLIVFLMNLIRKKSMVLRGSILIRALSLGISFAIVLILFTISVNNTKIANSVFLLYAGSIISSLLLGTILFKEKLTKWKIIAVVISLIGLGLFSHEFIGIGIGVITGFLSGIADGISNSLRKSLKGVEKSSLLVYQFSIGAIFALVLGLLFGEVFVKTFVLSSILVGILFGVLQVGLNNLLLYGFQHFDVNVGTVILATELFFATILGFLVFGEVPLTNEIIGGLLIFTASIISSVDIKVLLSRKNIKINHGKA